MANQTTEQRLINQRARRDSEKTNEWFRQRRITAKSLQQRSMAELHAIKYASEVLDGYSTYLTPAQREELTSYINKAKSRHSLAPSQTYSVFKLTRYIKRLDRKARKQALKSFN